MKNIKRIIALAMTLILAFAMVACSSDGIKEEGTQSELVQQINTTGKYLIKKVSSPTYGDETAVIALNRSTYIDYWHDISQNYIHQLDHIIKTNGYVLGDGSKKIVYAESYPDAIWTYTTCGIYANWASSQDLIEGISFDNVVMMAGDLNKLDALIALECGKYEMVERGDLTRQDLIDFAMEMQKADGSFTYSDMGEVTALEATATAVTGLQLTGEKDEVEYAINSGAEYLIANISKDDRPIDIIKTIIALNTTGIDATDVEGKNLIDYLMVYAKDDGSFSFDTTDKKGNKDDTSWALLALASQYRFENGMTSVYDMTDVLGATHNQLSPEWMLYVKVMICAIRGLGFFMLGLLIVSRIRIHRWRKEGIYNEQAQRQMTDAEIAAKRAAEATAAAENKNENE